MPDQIDLLKPETVKQIVVVENQIGKAIKVIEVFGFFRTGIRGRIDTSMQCQVVEESVPLLPEGTVKINDGRAFALDDHRVGREAARQFDILRRLDVHAGTFASPLTALTAGRAT